jgi:putative DNA primase/helicase
MTITVDELAAAKGFDADFLRGPRVGLYDTGGGVAIPYWSDADADEPVVKLRTALAARDGSRWAKGVSPRAYGEWRLDEARRQRRLLVVEGESDCWASWAGGFAALGLPGAGMAECLEERHLDCVDVVYVAHEPDQAGGRFVAGVVDQLAACNFRGVARELHMPAGTKDVCQLFQQAGRKFAEALDCCLEHAGRLSLPPATLSEAELCRFFNTLKRRPGAVELLAKLLHGLDKKAVSA